jgi:hypothetical protein
MNKTPEREAVPDWARAEREADAPDPNLWSPKQQQFVLDLIDQKDLSIINAEGQQFLAEIKRGERVMTKSKASELIDKLLKLPKAALHHGLPSENAKERFAVGVPAGRYAVEADNGQLRFYHVWVSRDGTRLNVYVAHGPDESDLKYQKTVMAVLNKIKTAGIRESAIKYGMEIGSCSNCGRRLTNHISRALGIGPICGGRMFGEDFKVEVKAKRAELKAAGINPDEEIS